MKTRDYPMNWNVPAFCLTSKKYALPKSISVIPLTKEEKVITWV